MRISVVANHGLNGAAEVVVIADSKGKERFRRPLRKGSNLSRLRRISLLSSLAHYHPLPVMCRSPLGAGVPAEAESEMAWYVLGKGLTLSQHFLLHLLSLSGHANPARSCAHSQFPSGFA